MGFWFGILVWDSGLQTLQLTLNSVGQTKVQPPVSPQASASFIIAGIISGDPNAPPIAFAWEDDDSVVLPRGVNMSKFEVLQMSCSPRTCNSLCNELH